MTEDIRLAKFFAANLVWLMRHNNETQAEVAQAIQVDQSMISGYVNGKNVPMVKNLMRIAEHFGVSVDELLTIQNRLDLCPYCGGQAKIVQTTNGWTVRADHAAGCYLGNLEQVAGDRVAYMSKELASEAWNRRGNEGC